MVDPTSSQKTQMLSLLITANHVLDHYGLTDGFGHISVRDPMDSSRFYMTGSTTPGFVSSESDLAHYQINQDASPVVPGDPKSNTSPFSERFCHSEVFKRFPSVQSVAHSHSRDVIVAGVSGVPMRPMFHMAGFLGSEGAVPVFDIAECYDRNERMRNMLVNSSELGAALAESLCNDDKAAMRTVEADQTPDYTVSLQRGHGFTCWGDSIQEAVYRAYYTQENARVQMAATDHSVVSLGEVKTVPLGEQEIRDCASMNKASVHKAWAYWSRVVAVNPMYKNELLRARDVERERNYWKPTESNRMTPF